ncbi:hypothetical protein L4D06_08690 [Enterovibrio makurazakiensis]|uniref:Uncharacterized protein n=1 Tax=Enterovibrio gelatinilyticus TaxID=2899819 RepID=A0ABT5QXB9_9GAMM|nr:hypothetical protein [Enterovibrio sp. ZSDZ42]MDD1792250.1 hypothetical protein [Enterovibrio sp. ZSDZ42]
MTPFTLGRKTIINECSLEYSWVRQQVAEGTDRNTVVSAIQQCFGGDEETASLFFNIAIGESSPGVLLSHLRLSNWSTFNKNEGNTDTHNAIYL